MKIHQVVYLRCEYLRIAIVEKPTFQRTAYKTECLILYVLTSNKDALLCFIYTLIVYLLFW